MPVFVTGHGVMFTTQLLGFAVCDDVRQLS